MNDYPRRQGSQTHPLPSKKNTSLKIPPCQPCRVLPAPISVHICQPLQPLPSPRLTVDPTRCGSRVRPRHASRGGADRTSAYTAGRLQSFDRALDCPKPKPSNPGRLDDSYAPTKNEWMLSFRGRRAEGVADTAGFVRPLAHPFLPDRPGGSVWPGRPAAGRADEASSAARGLGGALTWLLPGSSAISKFLRKSKLFSDTWPYTTWPRLLEPLLHEYV